MRYFVISFCLVERFSMGSIAMQTEGNFPSLVELRKLVNENYPHFGAADIVPVSFTEFNSSRDFEDYCSEDTLAVVDKGYAEWLTQMYATGLEVISFNKKGIDGLIRLGKIDPTTSYKNGDTVEEFFSKHLEVDLNEFIKNRK